MLLQIAYGERRTVSLLNFEDSNKSNPRNPKPIKLVLGIGALVGAIALGSTLAASINLNSGTPVEFGQGVTQTTACDDQVKVTPISTFSNDEESGFKFTAITLSDVDSTIQTDPTDKGCAGKTFTIKSYDSSGILLAPTYLISVDSDGYFASHDGPMDGTDWGYTDSSMTLYFADPTIDAESVYRITIESTDSIEVVPDSYEVGERGPGGGIVYYVSANYFTSTGSTCDTECKYLEVAPATWQSEGESVADDSIYQWSDDANSTTGQDIATVTSEGFSPDEKANWKIGQGRYNTSVMKVDGATSAARTAVLAYAGSSSAGQWFIPSMNELNELCKYARGQTTGDLTVVCDNTGTLKYGTANDLEGFMGDFYGSSSEYDATDANIQHFGNGNPYRYNKTELLYVRPIRAF